MSWRAWAISTRARPSILRDCHRYDGPRRSRRDLDCRIRPPTGWRMPSRRFSPRPSSGNRRRANTGRPDSASTIANRNGAGAAAARGRSGAARRADARHSSVPAASARDPPARSPGPRCRTIRGTPLPRNQTSPYCRLQEDAGSRAGCRSRRSRWCCRRSSTVARPPAITMCACSRETLAASIQISLSGLRPTTFSPSDSGRIVSFHTSHQRTAPGRGRIRRAGRLDVRRRSGSRAARPSTRTRRLRIVAERLPNLGHGVPEIGLQHHRVGPEPILQLGLRDQRRPPLDQDLQQVERLGRQMDAGRPPRRSSRVAVSNSNEPKRTLIAYLRNAYGFPVTRVRTPRHSKARS